MENLTVKHPLTRAYFVKSEVIFKINTDIYSDDECLKTNGLAVYAEPTETGDVAYHGEEKIPHFTVTDVDTNEITDYFLDPYITVGDSFDGSEFKKVLHSEEEEKMTAFTDYYKSLCEEQLEKYAIANYNKTFDVLFCVEDDKANGFDINKLKKIGIPVWIIVDNGKYTIAETENYVILTEQTFEEMIENGVKKEIYKNAVATANKYDFDLTAPSKYDDINITKKSES